MILRDGPAIDPLWLIVIIPAGVLLFLLIRKWARVEARSLFGPGGVGEIVTRAYKLQIAELKRLERRANRDHPSDEGAGKIAVEEEQLRLRTKESAELIKLRAQVAELEKKLRD